MRALSSKLLVLGFLALAIALALYYNLSKPRILILQSYSPAYSWTRDVNVGLNRVFDGHNRISLRWYYMGTKRHPWPEYRAKAGRLALRAVRAWKPDVIIAVDDDAQRLVARHFVDTPGISIVYAGVNGGVAKYGYDHADNVTGISERFPLPAIRGALLAAVANGSLPAKARMYYLGDRSNSVSADTVFVRHFAWSPVRLAVVRQVATFPQWQQAVAEAQRKGDFIMAANYHQLRESEGSRKLVPPRRVVAWTEANSKIPVIGLDGFFVDDGGMFSVGKSPIEQGRAAARMALQIVHQHRAASSIKPLLPSEFGIYMRGTLMQQFHFRLPPIYEAFARETGHYTP